MPPGSWIAGPRHKSPLNYMTDREQSQSYGITGSPLNWMRYYMTDREQSYGITGFPLNWMRSYITDREQSVNVYSAKSTKVRLNCAVPQGSVFVPLLFVLYGKDVIDIIKRHGLINHCHANDTSLYFDCTPKELDALTDAFGACAEELCVWMRSNRLKLNCEKTECM